VAIPPGGTGQGKQEKPQLFTSALDTQLPAQRWKPELQMTPQLAPSQTAVALAGAGHAVHETPQLWISAFERQTPLHSCSPAAQNPRHACTPGMQAPAHNFIPAGQLAPHWTPSHVAVPPIGTAHGVQDTPQLATSLFETQRWLHRCVPAAKQSSMHVVAAGDTQAPAHSLVPAGQNAPQLTPSHVAPPPVGAAQGKQLSPQWATSIRDTQIPPQI
jgi:hypothetical protein